MNDKNASNLSVLPTVWRSPIFVPDSSQAYGEGDQSAEMLRLLRNQGFDESDVRVVTQTGPQW